MTRPRRSTIYVKKRAVTVERKAVRPRVGKASALTKIAAKYNQKYDCSLSRPILAEVERALSHRPIAFPQKLWGEVL